MSRRRPDWVLLLAVLTVGIGTRLSALYRSPLPFNTDGFVFVSSAERMLAADAVAFGGPGSPAPDEYLFASLIAVVSEIVGVQPLYVAQVVIACLAAVPSLVVVEYVRSLTSELPRTHSRAAAAFAGIGLAVQGPYLFRTMSVNAEVFGLAVLACFVLALHRTLQTGDGRWLAATVGLAILVPVVHNLSALVLGVVGTTLVALEVARSPTLRRVVGGAVGVVSFWIVTAGYYDVTGLAKTGAVSTALGLFVAWTVLVVACGRWLDTATPTVQRGVPIVAFGVCTVVMLLNAAVAVFPGTSTTPTLLLFLTLPLAVPLLVAIYGLPRLASSRGRAMFAAIFGPLALVGFALSAGRTPAYHDLFLRSTTFLHPGLLVAAGVGLAWLVRHRPAIGRGVAVLAVIAILVSAPLPFAGLQAFPFEPVTEEDEFDAATFATERVERGWATDEHLALVANNYQRSNATSLPTTAWLRGDAPPPDCPTLARSSWSTTGVPTTAEPLTISRTEYERWIVTGDVVYASGADSSIVLLWAPGTCSGSNVEGSP